MLKYFLLFLVTGSALSVYGQDTTYYNQRGNPVTASALYDHSEILIRDPTDSNGVTVKRLRRSGTLQSVSHYSDYRKKVLGGAYEDYYEDGKLYSVANYQEGMLEGELKSYWENGQLKRDDFFSKDKFLKGKCFDSTGKAIRHTPWMTMPEFRGGEKGLLHYLSKEVHYPKHARENDIQGTVIVQFSIEKDGLVDQVAVTQHVAAGIDAEAVRVISRMPRWKPGLKEGEKAKVQYSLPIRFQLK